jgi:hypothetical protein
MQHIKIDYSGWILLVLVGLFVRTEIVEACRIFERFKFSNYVNVKLKMGTSRAHMNKKFHERHLVVPHRPSTKREASGLQDVK